MIADADGGEDRELERVGDAPADVGVERGVGRGPLAPRLHHPLDGGGEQGDDAEDEHRPGR